jgi:hypothetical protein
VHSDSAPLPYPVPSQPCHLHSSYPPQCVNDVRAVVRGHACGLGNRVRIHGISQQAFEVYQV